MLPANMALPFFCLFRCLSSKLNESPVSPLKQGKTGP